MQHAETTVNEEDPWGNEGAEPPAPAAPRTVRPASAKPWTPTAAPSALVTVGFGDHPTPWGMTPEGVSDILASEDEEEAQGTHLPEWFWLASGRLAQIHQAADAYMCSPDAVLNAVLARVGSLVSPSVRASSGVGRPATLGWFSGLYGPSGCGKGAAEHAAEDLAPFRMRDRMPDLRHIDPSTGAGLLAMYMESELDPASDDGKTKILCQRYTRGYVLATEGSILGKLTATVNGATLDGILCKAWMSERQGTSNATVELRRELAGAGYVLSMSVSVQQDAAAALLGMSDVGIPQRLAWADARQEGGDPEDIPEELPENPGAIVDGSGTPLTDAVYGLADLTLTLPEEARREIRATLWRRKFAGHECDPLDTHEPLWRVKCASLLALLHGRRDVDAMCWLLAGVMWDTSRAVRNGVVEETRRAQRAKHEAEAEMRKREAVVTAGAVQELVTGVHPVVDQVARRARLRLDTAGPMASRDLNRAVANSRAVKAYRESGADDSLWTAVLEYAIDRRWIDTSPDGTALLPGDVSPE